VDRLVLHRRSRGVTAWTDAGLDPGDPVFPAIIEERITQGSALIVVWTRAASTSEWVRREIVFPQQRGKRILVLSFDGTPPGIEFVLSNIEDVTTAGGRRSAS
jgi:hypothetical protein